MHDMNIGTLPHIPHTDQRIINALDRVADHHFGPQHGNAKWIRLRQPGIVLLGKTGPRVSFNNLLVHLKRGPPIQRDDAVPIALCDLEGARDTLPTMGHTDPAMTRGHHQHGSPLQYPSRRNDT